MKYIYEVEHKSLSQRLREEQAKKQQLVKAIEEKKSKKRKLKETISVFLTGILTTSILSILMLLSGWF